MPASNLVVHHLRVSQSERVVWLCEELGLSYELKCYDREESMMAPKAYKDISPIGTAPVIEDLDTYTPNPEKIALAESQACIEWIVRKYGHGNLVHKPWDSNWKEWLFWWHFTNGSLQPVMAVKMVAPRGSPGAQQADARLDQYLNLVEERLGKSKYIVGDDFTAADIMLVFPLTTMRTFLPLDLGPYPNILRYLKEIGERPAYQRAMDKGETKLKPMLDAKPPAALFSPTSTSV